MARGWESKSIEAQQEAAAERRTRTVAITPEEGSRLAERATLSLARTRALADLQCACAPAHRAMLEQAIADLDRRIADLENPKPQIPKPNSQKPR
jgi:DNA-binding MurR/RpiR family transcriptional regulator